MHFSADVNSISTNNEQRDAHLRNPDFFDTDNHPKLTFETERMEKVDEENYKVYGVFTLRGVSKEIILYAEFGGTAADAWGNTRAGFSLTGKINRKDFGVSFGLLSEATSAVLSDEVKLFVNAQFIKQKVAELQEAV